MRKTVLILLCLLALAAAWLLWPSGNRPAAAVAKKSAIASASSVAAVVAASTNNNSSVTVAVSTNKLAYRLANTSKSIGQLMDDRHAILLENALIDTTAGLTLNIPASLKAKGDPGAYIVQARGLVDAPFRAALADAGAQIVSYIPNNAYLVRLTPSGAGALAGKARVQAVLPYEPYYKISSSIPVGTKQKTASVTAAKISEPPSPTLLALAVQQKPLPPGTFLTLGLFGDGAATTISQIEKLGGKIVGEDRSPFGLIVHVQPPPDWISLALLPGVQLVEPATRRASANDLSRMTTGVAVDTQIATNYLGLTGKNVMVEVNDTGIDATHPDLTGRIFGALTTDTDGHGTHVAGIIAGDGTKSTTVTNASGSIMPGTNGQFRGSASQATLLAMDLNNSDQNLQEAAARTNALISNNSWVYGGVNAYDLAAASYDAAVRDALPTMTGPQPVLFVFAAGNDGNGDDTTDPGRGIPDTIGSPGTAKNVITVGAIQMFRDITNEVTNADGTIGAPWQSETSTDYRIAGFSSRGNVGIGTEGTFGRYKPDVVAPGTFVLSTRSSQWDIGTYFTQNPTNYDIQDFSVLLQPNSLATTQFPAIPTNTVGVTIQLVGNPDSPTAPISPILPIYYGLVGSPFNSYSSLNNQVAIPQDGTLTIGDILNSETFYAFNFAISNSTTVPINFDVLLDTITTNYYGNYFLVLSNLNQSIGSVNPASTGPGPYYRYESGTSMAAADVSGVLALMQDYFTNRLQLTPSPVLLKAMLINGARPTGPYDLQVQNNINYEGWGLVNLTNSLPSGVTNQMGIGGSSFFTDQSPTNALATGDSHTISVAVANGGQVLPLRVTLAWTDPPGNPAAAIKLVNNLDLIVSNLDGTPPAFVYYGNDIPSGSSYNTAETTNTTVTFDSVNNVENVFIAPSLATNYSITVIARDVNVNVNAVTTQTNNIVQDYALVVSCGEGEVTNAITITDSPIVLNPVAGQQITFVTSTNQPLFNQTAGASSPLLGTNTLVFDTTSGYATNAVLTIGQTNQWHFYVVTNNTTFTNAAFMTFPQDETGVNTLAIPREGVFADSDANSTRPDADIEIFVSTDPTLTNLNLVVISNCVNGTQVGASIGNVFNGASLSRGGTEFVADTNSTPGQVYYVGVQSEDQMSALFGFLPIFSQNPFSLLNPNGSQTVNGLLMPATIPDGSPAHPGKAYVFALALYPMTVSQVVVSNQIFHENFGDLIGSLAHNGIDDVLNNHDSFGNPPGPYNFIYDDSRSGNTAGSVASDGPGTLRDFTGSSAMGPWILTEVDDALTQTGVVTSLTLNIQPHKDLTHGLSTVTVQPNSWFYGYVDVPVGYTNMTVVATNLTLPYTPPILLALQFNAEPTLNNNIAIVALTNGVLQNGNSISYGPPLQPGRYWVGLFNPDSIAHDVLVGVTLAFNASAIETVNYASGGVVPLLDDAVTYDTISVTNTDVIQGFNVGLRVDHPRISDLVFHLIRPDGTRYLLMENRGGQSTNGCGVTVITTNNIANVTANGTTNAFTNSFPVGQLSGTLPISWNFLTVPDEMTVYDNTNNNYGPANLIFDTGMISGSGQTNLPYTTTTGLTIIINQFGNPSTNGDAWNYTAGGVLTNYYYLTFTEDTNLTTTPIKFAVPPFVPGVQQVAVTNASSTTNMQDGFDSSIGGTYVAPSVVPGTGWQTTGGSVDILNAGNTLPQFLSDSPSNCLDLSGFNAGTIATNFNTVPGQRYYLSFAYTKNASPANPGYPFFVASAQISITGLAPFTLNTPPTFTNSYTALNWQHTNYAFTATSPTTTLQFTSLNPGDGGMFLDSISVSTTNVNYYGYSTNLYYLPEQDISGLIGTSAFGDWQLEVLDNRAGAGLTNSLLSWQLEFTFANTNFIPPVPPTIIILTNMVPSTNSTSIPSNGAVIYQVNVPLNADYATNRLLFADVPLNVWWSTNAWSSINSPPTVGAANDVLLITNLTSGSFVMNLTNSVPLLIPGTTYYLVVQNTNSVPATNYAVEVDFHLLGTAYSFTEPATLVTGTSAQLNGMATPNGFPSFAWFQWGTNTLYGNQTTPFPVGSGSNVVYTTAQISGLVTNVAYHFRLVVSNAVGVVAGFDQVLDEANVVAWGADYAGQINVPTNFNNMVAIAGAYDHSLALKTNGLVVAWGDNTFGQANVPASVSNVVAVAGGQYYSLVLKSDQTVAAWGANLLNQTNVPAGLNSVVEIAGGTYSSLALKNNGAVVAWGANFFGLTNVPVGASNTVAIAGGNYHSLALKNDGTVTAWGDDSSGQTNLPAGLTNVVAIAAGGYHSLALINDGTVVAWGDDSSGQTNVPASATNVVAIAAGGFHSLALKADGTVVTWGDDSAGQLNVPVGLTNVVAIAGGYLHSLVLTPQFLINSTNFTVLPLDAGVPQTNNILPGDITYYQVNVPTNADFSTNNLLFTQNGPLNVWFATNTPPTLGVTNATLLFGGATNGVAILGTNGSPAIIPGSTYYLGVQNTNSVTVTYAIEVTFHLVTSTNVPPPTNAITIFSIIYTNIGGSNGFLLTWFAPSNDLFQVQWTPSLAPTAWTTFTNIISYNTNFFTNPTNAQFNFFDDASQTGGTFGSARFYRLILYGSGSSSNSPPVINSVFLNGSGMNLQWLAPTNEQFQVRWTTNLAPTIIWTLYPDNISPEIITSTNGTFLFTDTNAPLIMKFYQLILLP